LGENKLSPNVFPRSSAKVEGPGSSMYVFEILFPVRCLRPIPWPSAP